jgi:hypothetical protein
VTQENSARWRTVTNHDAKHPSSSALLVTLSTEYPSAPELVHGHDAGGPGGGWSPTSPFVRFLAVIFNVAWSAPVTRPADRSGTAKSMNYEKRVTIFRPQGALIMVTSFS